MTRSHTLVLASCLTASLAMFAGCEGKPQPAPAPAPPKPAAAGTPAPDPHDHDHDHDHHAHGTGSDLGTVALGGYSLRVTQEGAIEEGKDSGFEIKVSGTDKPVLLRAWIGLEDAKGSVKAKAALEGDGFDVHVETPKPIPADSKLWIEVESSGGRKSTGSIALKR